MFTIAPPFWGRSAAATTYLLDEFAGTGSMDAWAPEVGYDTGNWVNGFSGVVYFAERVGGRVMVKAPDVQAEITYGADPAATPVLAPLKFKFTFWSGLESTPPKLPRLQIFIQASGPSMSYQWTLDCKSNDAVNWLLDVGSWNSDTGVGAGDIASPAPTVAWETAYEGELIIASGNQTLTFLGRTLVTTETWDEPLTTVQFSIVGWVGVERVEITSYTPP